MALFVYVPSITTFGGFALPNVLKPPVVTRGARPRVSTPAGLPGVYSQGPFPAEKRITVSGKIVTTPGQTLAAAKRELWAGLPFGPLQLLVLRTDAASYFPCEVEGVTEGESLADCWLNYDAMFLCPGGLEYTSASTTAALAAGANALTSVGTWAAAPIVTVNVTAAPAGGTVTLTRGDGKFWTLRPAQVGAWVLDALAEIVTAPDGSDGWASLAPGSLLLELAPGANTLTLTTAGGASAGAASITWQERYQ
jgi:hypothetical protein